MTREEAARNIKAIRTARAKDAAAKARVEVYRKARVWA